MSLRRSFFFILLLAALAAYIWKVELPQVESKKVAEAPFADLKKEAFKSVTLKKQGATFTILNQKAVPAQPGDDRESIDSGSLDVRNWKVAGVVPPDADGPSVNSLLSSVIELKTTEQIPAGEVLPDPAVYGLKEPEVSIEAEYFGPDGLGQKAKIELGKKNEYLNSRYLKLERDGSGGIYLVSDSLFTAAGKTRDDFRKRGVFDLYESDTERISLSSPAGTVNLEKKGSDWVVKDVGDKKASGDKVSELFRQLRNIKVKDFLEGEKASVIKEVLQKASYKITLEPSAKAKKNPVSAVFAPDE